MPAKRALLIGVAAYPNVPPLDGCVNDVGLMRSVLVERFGFPEAQITVLADRQATRAGILAAFDALVAATGTDDIVVFHFAGHGSRMADREGDEPSGFDSTIVPFDAARPANEVADITDDEIQLRLEALAAKTPYTTLVFDACHSGTITRDDFGARARSVQADDRVATDLPPSPIPPDRRRPARAVGPSGWMPLTDRYVLIAGCRDDEESYEYRPPEGGGSLVHGSLTYFLCQQLRRAPADATYRDVFERTAALVNAVTVMQHPQMEGSADRAVFGVTDFVPAAYVRVLEREGDRVLLASGAAHGAAVGSTYRVFPQGARDPRARGSIGDVEIIDVQAVTALASIAREDPPGAIGPDARAFETAHAFRSARVPVRVVAGDVGEVAVGALQARFEDSPCAAVVTGGAPASACVYGLPARTDVLPASPVPQAGPLAEPCWAVVGEAGHLLMPLQPLDAVDDVVRKLERIAKYRLALAIENPDPDSRLRGKFTVELQRLGDDRRTWSVAAPAPDAGQIVFEEGDIIRVVVRSRHDGPVFVSLFDFGLSSDVNPIYPASGAQEVLRAGGTLASGAQRLGFPAAHPFVDAAGRASGVEGLETAKLFATEEPTSFTGLEQEGVRAGEWSPLASLFASVFEGKTTRDTTAVPLEGEDWTTVSTSFVLRRRAPAAS
jgi:hypothetical protein